MTDDQLRRTGRVSVPIKTVHTLVIDWLRGAKHLPADIPNHALTINVFADAMVIDFESPKP